MRKKLFALILSALLVAGTFATFTAGAASFAGEEWYDGVSTAYVNREPGRTYFIPYQDAQTALDNEESALTRDFARSSYFQSLNGDWKFKLVTKPENRISGFQETGYDDSAWDTVTVPRSWQTYRNADGTLKYDHPIYVNQRYPWTNYEPLSRLTDPKAPTVYNPVGHYRRSFTLPENWNGREVFVSFQGVESCIYLYVNGQYVGYASDSYTASEFNLTPYLHAGENQISAQVYRWSVGSFLENQDFIRLSGIFRDVFLYSKDKVELRDFFVRTDFDNFNENANLSVEASIRNFAADKSGKYSVEATLMDMDDNPVWNAPLTIPASVTAADSNPSEVTVKASKWVQNPKKWFADSPNLYKLLIQLKDPQGGVVETAVERVGFRTVKLVEFNAAGQRVMQINGQNIVLRGVNRHEISPETGRALSHEDILKDLKIMKQHNINAIRTSHYPEDPFTYALADELGFYICDEANIESHYGATAGDLPSGLPVWKNTVLDRMQSMVERDKNHPSVVIWSLGNEATYKTYALNDNYCFYVGSNWIKARDRSRPVKYERDNRNALVDIYSVQYPSVGYASSYAGNTANKMPFIMSEYSHSMGNAAGSFTEYWDEFRKYPNAQGGFIWDFVDQSIWMPTDLTPPNYFTTAAVPAALKKEITGTFAVGRNGTKALSSSVLKYDVDSRLNAASNQLTIEAWVKPGTKTASHNDIVSKGDNGYTLKVDANGKFEFFVDSYGAGTISAAVPDDWYDGTWKQLVAVFDGTAAENPRMSIYVNGTQVATGNRTNVLADSTASATTYPLTIGDNPQYPGRKFKGLIDGVHIYKKALTVEEINDQTRTAADAGVVFWNDFDSVRIEQIAYDDERYFAYGGDWGETVTDNSFCGNGILFADRTPKPFATEVKYAHQEVWFEAVDLAKGKVKVTNEFLNTSLDKYAHNWTITEDNKVVKSGTLNLDLAPETSEVVTIDTTGITAKPGAEYFLNFSTALKADTWWEKAGFEIAHAQFKLPIRAKNEAFKLDVDTMPGFSDVINNETQVVAEGENFKITFDKTRGEMTSFIAGGKEMIDKSLIINHWRAPGNNDTSYDSTFKKAWANKTITALDVQAEAKVINISVTSRLTARSSTNVTKYSIYSSGDVVVNNSLTPGSGASNLLRVGMEMKLPAAFKNIEYYGKGPGENYSDRNVGSFVGVFGSTVDKQYSPYLMPQFFGNRTDVRWMSLTDDAGDGLLVTTKDRALSMSAVGYDAADYEGKRHMYMVKKSNPILSIDYAQAGIGSAACGPGPRSQYLLPGSGTYSYTYRLTPITASMDTAAKMTESKRSFDIMSKAVNAIYVGGKKLAGFNAGTQNYTYKYLEGVFTNIPQVSVDASAGVDIEITQPAAFDGTATVVATIDGVEKTYTITLIPQAQVYASDMEWLPESYSGYDSLQRDRKVEHNQPLTITNAAGTGSQIFAKGIGTHAYSEVYIDIEGMGFDMFESWVGVDVYQRSPNADVSFEVYVDGVKAYDSGSMKYLTPARKVEVPVTGAKQVTLVATLGSDNRNANDHADWCDSKFTKFTPTTVSELRLNETTKTVTEGDQFKLSAVSVCDDGKPAMLPVTWTVEQGDQVLRMDDGNPASFEALKAGTAIIKATSVMDPTKSATCAVTVNAAGQVITGVTGMQVNLSSVSLKVGETYTIKGRVLPTNAENQGFSWSLASGESVTYTANADGTVTVKAVDVGDSVIRATSDEGGFKADCKFTVEASDFFTAAHADVKENNIVTVRASVTNQLSEPVPLNLIVSLYNKNGALVQKKYVSLSADDVHPYTFDFDVTGLEDGYYFKTFTWSQGTYRPLYEAITLS